MSALEVVTFGEIIGNLVACNVGPLENAERFERRLAGSELNTAIALARLGHRVGYVGRVGVDLFGRAAADRLREEGIDATWLVHDRRAHTGLQIKQRVAQGDPQYLYYRNDSAGSMLTVDERTTAYLATARHLHATGIPPALSGSARAFAVEAFDAARAHGLGVSFDPNLRPSLWRDRQEMVDVVNTFAHRADWVLPGLDEGEALTGSGDAEGIAEYYLAHGAKGVAVKRGAAGATVFTAAGSWHCPGFVVDVADTLGAGDGFAAGLVSGLLDGLEPPMALRRACAVGALATTSAGDCDGMPTMPQVELLLTAGPQSLARPVAEDRQVAHGRSAS
jgi:sugar/nucleoside kinase (ribokinase family)